MVNSANVAHFTNTWYPNGKLKPFRSSPEKCEEYWEDLVQAFEVRKNLLNISRKDDKNYEACIEICCKEFGFIVEQWFGSKNIGPKSNAWKISIGNAKERNLTDFSILVICNFKQFYFYDPATEKHYGPIEGNAIVNNIPPVLKSLFGNKWAKRLDDSLNFESFDGINDGNLQKRWGYLKKRIAIHGGPTTSSFALSSGSTYHPTLYPAVLSWNKNLQCLPTWESIQVKPDVSSERCRRTYERWNRNNKDGDLVLMRHMYWEFTLKYATYFDSYFSDISKDAEEDIYTYFFWLINKGEADFIYAILKSSMFRAWCELTAYTDGGEGHFTTGMWDTFPLPRLTPSQKSSIIIAGQELKMGWPWSQCELDRLIDRLFVPCILSPLLTDVDRKQILAEGFLNAFYGA